MRQNCLQDTFAILQHLVVPEPKDFPALAFQIGVTNIVARAFCVLRAVSFDDQLSANAKKVDNVGADRNLPAKLNAIQTTVAQQAPEAKLAVGRRSAHRSSARALVRRDACISLHRLSIGGAALIRRAFGAPPSPRGRRGRDALIRPRSARPPSPWGRRGSHGAVQHPFSLGEKVAGEAGRMRAPGSRLRKRLALRRQLLQ
jgi:hypothetical protein